MKDQAPSAALLAAEERRRELQAQAQADRAAAIAAGEIRPAAGERPSSPAALLQSGRMAAAGEPARSPASWELHNGTKELDRRRRARGIKARRSARPDQLEAPAAELQPDPDPGAFWRQKANQARADQDQADDAQPDQAAPAVKHYPDLGLATLRSGRAVYYRLWLLARAFDYDGRGMVDLARFKDRITAAGSPWQTFTRQRVGQLLAGGAGLFWHIETGPGGERLRLTGAAAMARALGVERLTGSPVLIDRPTLTGKIKRFKAALYASWHAGRPQSERSGQPVTRAKLAELTGHDVRTLQRYDQAAGITRRRNVAIGPRRTVAGAQRQAWDRGGAVFTFNDHLGRQGARGGVYLAWHLPNSYKADMRQAARGRQRKINKRLAIPRDHGARGNGLRRIFHDGPKEAGAAINRAKDQDHYWPMTGGRQAHRSQLWQGWITS